MPCGWSAPRACCLDRQVLFPDGIRRHQVGNRPAPADAALLDDGRAVADRAGRNAGSARTAGSSGPPPSAPWMAAAIRSTMTGRQTLGRLVQQDGRGLPISVRAMVSICCSPPLIRPPGRSRMSPRLGNSANSRSGVQGGAPARRRAAADLQVLQHGQVGEDAPFLRHVAEAEPGDPSGSRPAIVGAGEADPPGAGRHQAHDRLHGGGLAGAVAAEQRHHLAPPPPPASRRTGYARGRNARAGRRPTASMRRPSTAPEPR